MERLAALLYPPAAVHVWGVHFWGVVKEGTQSGDDPSSDGGKGRVAMATPAPDLPDQLELAQNERREKRDRQTDRSRGKAGGPDEAGGSERCQKFRHQDGNEQEG